MTLVNHETGEVIVSYGEVKASVEKARASGTTFFEQVVWQIENRAWTVLGYGDWDEMRDAEYGDMGVVVPRADRPEIVSRLRRTGMTQADIAATLGVSQPTVAADLNIRTDIDPPITNTRGHERPASYAKRPTNPVADDSEGVSDETPRPNPNAQAEAQARIDAREDAARERAYRGLDSLVAETSAAPTVEPKRHLEVAPDLSEYDDQDHAEELARNLSRNLSLLFAVTNPERRAEYIATWRAGIKEVQPLGSDFITPEHMRTLARALETFADEWESADV